MLCAGVGWTEFCYFHTHLGAVKDVRFSPVVGVNTVDLIPRHLKLLLSCHKTQKEWRLCVAKLSASPKSYVWHDVRRFV